MSVASRHTTSPCQTQAVMFRIQQSANRHHAHSNLNCLSWGAYTVFVSLAVDTCHRASQFSPTGDVVRVITQGWTPATLLLLQDLLLEVGHLAMVGSAGLVLQAECSVGSRTVARDALSCRQTHSAACLIADHTPQCKIHPDHSKQDEPSEHI